MSRRWYDSILLLRKQDVYARMHLFGIQLSVIWVPSVISDVGERFQNDLKPTAVSKKKRETRDKCLEQGKAISPITQAVSMKFSSHPSANPHYHNQLDPNLLAASEELKRLMTTQIAAFPKRFESYRSQQKEKGNKRGKCLEQGKAISPITQARFQNDSKPTAVSKKERETRDKCLEQGKAIKPHNTGGVHEIFITPHFHNQPDPNLQRREKVHSISEIHRECRHKKALEYFSFRQHLIKVKVVVSAGVVICPGAPWNVLPSLNRKCGVETFGKGFFTLNS
ncbi:hypothetical protein CDAR_418931 [Caerostris darwini]|uniref:Uncharacterized protein n=1 Tax=Caerostris darwini TaxID=1538125 RepID=A0AAV4MZF3_9ARAC|nr:hypothetical protein CDAR_418931 [Caerostris darwini]